MNYYLAALVHCIGTVVIGDLAQRKCLSEEIFTNVSRALQNILSEFVYY